MRPSAEAPGTRHFLEGERAQLAVAKYIKHPTTPDELFQAMVGPQVAQIQQRLEAEGPQSDPLSEEIRLAQIELYKHPFWSPEYMEGYKRVTKLQAQHRKERSRIETRPPLEPLPRPSDTGPRDVRRESRSQGCERPQTDPEGVKRAYLPHFWLGRAGREHHVADEAQLMIFGGAMLAVFCLALLLLQFGPF